MTTTYYVGLDVYKDTIAAAVADAAGKRRFFGQIANTPDAVTKLAAKLGISAMRPAAAVTASIAIFRTSGTAAMWWHLVSSEFGEASG